MSSGEKAKPPANLEERNPFDISRRSGTDVASEIAKRMAAWKQARARTNATPATTISSDSKSPPPIAAPVQPARMPKSTAPASQPLASTAGARSSGSAAPRAPYFASASAIRRAMPPAPNLKQGGARQQASTDDELATRAGELATPLGAPVLEPPPQNEPPRDAVDAASATAKPETPLADETSVAPASIEEDRPDVEAAPVPASSDPVEPSVAEAPIAVEPDGDERRRAIARAIKARWIAARDLDALIDTSGAGRDAGNAPTIEAAVPAVAAAHEAGSGDGPDMTADEPRAAAVNLDGPLPDDDVARRGDEQPPSSEHDLAAAAKAEEPAPEVAVEVAAATAPIARATPETAPVAEREDGRKAQALDLAALDDLAGRREPTFDTPAAHATPEIVTAVHPDTPHAVHETGIAAQDEVGGAPLLQPVARVATERATLSSPDVAGEGLSIAALDEVAGRKEPTFDAPVQREPLQRHALAIEPSVQADRDAAQQAREIETVGARQPGSDKPIARTDIDLAPATSTHHEAVKGSPEPGISALDRAGDRKEPTFDEPARPAKPAAAAMPAPRITLRAIETRIEARRIDSLRADPQLSARRPIFPHIEPEEWDLSPVVASQASRQRRGTGWAIGLGSVLLIAGITAPAAIWQQGRQAQDQVALVNPTPTPQFQNSAPTAATTTQAPARATLPGSPQPQPETPPPAPAQGASAVTPRESSPANAGASKSEAGQTGTAPTEQLAEQPATALGAISDGGVVNEAPVVAPPSPMVNLASKTGSAATGAPMVARPFVPEQGKAPFLRAPTTGAASVPVAGAPVQPAGAGVKPNLIVQLKPKASIPTAKPVASKPVTRKPRPFFQQSPEQMFQTLIDTLGEGKPVNPATKPASPSYRR